jgi:hypothetical protein
VTSQWVVLLNTGAGAIPFGPFDDEALAGRYASYLRTEVDPAEVAPIRSPVADLLAFWHNHRNDETAGLPKPVMWPPNPGDIWEDSDRDRWICCRTTATTSYLVCVAKQGDDSAEEIWRRFGPLRFVSHVPPNVEEPPF